MNFFEAQERARKNTGRLVALFILSVAGLILVTTTFVSWFYFHYISDDGAPFSFEKYFYSPIFLDVSVVIFMLVGLGALYEYLQLSKGGQNVAEALGGRKLSPNSANEAEKRLLNVVEEMSIASGILTPTVYMLEESSINAFAAGLTIDDAVIGITRGAVEKLDRNELQGVIAHEFSHIFNGDMRLNMNLAATLYGVTLIAMIGEFLVRHLRFSSSRTRKGGGGAVVILGFGLLAIGYIGVFFASLIKASVSRSREYLADATAVQYTRYPAGIAGALKKILYYHSGIDSPSAKSYAHFYFAQGVSSLFATHPPLKERIHRIDRKWDGKIPEYETAEKKVVLGEKEDHKAKRERFIQGAVTAAALASVGTMEEDEVKHAHDSVEKLDQEIREKLNDPLGAQAAILALFYEEVYKEAHFASLKEHSPYLLLEFASLVSKGVEVYQKEALLIISLALYSLKGLSVEQYRTFDTLMQTFVDIDQKVSMYEWSLMYMIRRNLQIYFGERKVPKKLKHTHIGAVKNELEIVFSMLIHDQYESEEAARMANADVMRKIGAGALQYRYSDTISHEMFESAMKEIELAKPGVAKRIFEGVLHSVKVDSVVTPGENLFVHAVALLLQVPLPREFVLQKEVS
ncbi:MAG: M48 family metallopeptidase [Sulfurimonas sp.]